MVLGVEVRPDGLDVFVTEEAGDAPVPFEGQSREPGMWYLPVSADPGVLDDTVVADPVPLTLFSAGQRETEPCSSTSSSTRASTYVSMPTR